LLELPSEDEDIPEELQVMNALYPRNIALLLTVMLCILHGFGIYAVAHPGLVDTNSQPSLASRDTTDNQSNSNSVLIFFVVISGIALLVILIFLVRHLINRIHDREKQIIIQSDKLDNISEQQTEVEEKYLTLFNRINDGVVVSSLSADGEFSSMQEMNKQACLILGRTEARLKSMRIKDLFEESEKAGIPDLVSRLQMQRSHLFRTRIVTEEGRIRNVEINASLTEANGGWRVIAVIRDISERINREEDCRKQMTELKRIFEKRTRELEEANKEVNLLAGTVSHDLQAPLRTVQDSLMRIKKKWRTDDPDLDNDLTLSINQIKKTTSLIKGILEYSRLGRNDLDIKPVGLSQICSEVLLQLDGVIRAEDADVKIERPMPRVIAHASTLFRIVQNIVSNAVKYVGSGVKPEVMLRAETRNNVVRLWIIDNGIGIAPEYQERIFNVFERLHTSEEYPGIGLGLAIVKRGIKRMNGSIGLISEVGEGSRFWIELPAADDDGNHPVFY
jgi:PAS domain S-box-containing protein